MKMKGLPDLVVPSFVMLYGECNAKVASSYTPYSWW